MMPIRQTSTDTSECFRAAVKLHEYLVRNSCKDGLLVGPDAGVRFNWRIGRFVKSYLSWVRWSDDLCYVQAQGYWILDNWQLFGRTREERYRELAIECTERVIQRQRSDGAWDYPNPEWKGRVATAECTWGSTGLIESYRQTGRREYLDAALRWYEFLIGRIGFQQVGDELAVNYFAEQARPRVPNNTAFVLRFLAELADVTGDRGFLQHCPGMVLFLRNAQGLTGELPYGVSSPGVNNRRPHFICAHYNAFECLDMMRYYKLTDDNAVRGVIEGIFRFLRASLQPDGHVRYDCNSRSRRMVFHSAVVGAAFAMGSQLGIGGDSDIELAQRAFAYVLQRQRADGSFPCSEGEYGMLRDNRVYPRVLGYMLYHLLTNVQAHPAEMAA